MKKPIQTWPSNQWENVSFLEHVNHIRDKTLADCNVSEASLTLTLRTMIEGMALKHILECSYPAGTA